MTFFILMIIPYLIGLALLACLFMSLRFLPYVFLIAALAFGISWFFG